MPSKWTPPTARLLPVASLLLAATMWGLLWYPLRLLEHGGLPGIWITLVSYAAASAVGVLYLVRRHARPWHRPGLLIAILLAAGWCNVSFIIAVLEGTVVRVVLLFYLSPVWTVLLGRLFLGERLDPMSWLVVGVAMVGAMLMLWVPAMGLPWPQDGADWLAISAGLAFSGTNVLVRAGQDVSVPVKTTAAWLGGLIVASAWVVLDHQALPVAPGSLWLGAVALGIGGIVVMTLSVQYGVTHMPVHRSAVILLFELVVVAVSTQLLTNETMNVREWAGGLLIVGAGLLTALGEKRKT